MARTVLGGCVNVVRYDTVWCGMVPHHTAVHPDGTTVATAYSALFDRGRQSEVMARRCQTDSYRTVTLIYILLNCAEALLARHLMSQTDSGKHYIYLVKKMNGRRDRPIYI